MEKVKGTDIDNAEMVTEAASKEDLESQVAELLARERISFEVQPVVGGVVPDFVVRAPEGRIIVVETKSWERSPGFLRRAQNQVKLYERVTGVDKAYLVLDQLKRNNPSQGVVTVDGLIGALREEIERGGRGSGRVRTTETKTIIFAAMPFAEEYDDVYLVAMAHAADCVGAACKRLDRMEYSGNIIHKMEQMIRLSAAVIVDLSESNPNVLYEAGFAHGLRKPTVHICSTPLKNLPFDVQQWSTITYKKGQTVRLKDPLARRLAEVLRR